MSIPLPASQNSPPNLTLYFLQASRSIRPAWLLIALDIPYTIKFSDREKNKAPLGFKKEGGTKLGKFPVLVVGEGEGELRLEESGAIVEWVFGFFTSFVITSVFLGCVVYEFALWNDVFCRMEALWDQRYIGVGWDWLCGGEGKRDWVYVLVSSLLRPWHSWLVSSGKRDDSINYLISSSHCWKPPSLTLSNPKWKWDFKGHLWS